MPTDALDDWSIGERSGRVSIGIHALWLSTYGPERKSGDPLVIIIPGLASSTMGWAAVQRGLSSFARVLQYERSGYGGSACSLKRPTASTIAEELSLLLRNAKLLPPYVMVAHSWGGVLSREFLALHPNDIVGMVFIEANQERTLDVLDWRHLALSDLLLGINYLDVTGISHAHKLTSDEWRVYQDTEDTEKHRIQAGLEFAEYANSFAILASKSQLRRETPLLGERPVCVIKGNNRTDFEKLLDAGLARGNGKDANELVTEFRETLSRWDEKDRELQTEALLLSSNSQYLEARNSGHNVHLTEPEVVVEGVRWVWSQARKSVE